MIWKRATLILRGLRADGNEKILAKWAATELAFAELMP
jgi:hypothetical protein